MSDLMEHIHRDSSPGWGAPDVGERMTRAYRIALDASHRGCSVEVRVGAAGWKWIRQLGRAWGIRVVLEPTWPDDAIRVRSEVRV